MTPPIHEIPNERRQFLTLSEEMLDDIAERAAEKAIVKMEEKLYIEVGRSFVSKFLKLIGLLVIALSLYTTKGDLSKLLQ